VNKISKEKRDKLILTCLAILGVIGILYTFVLGDQKDKLASLQNQISSTKDKLSKAERLVRSGDTIDARLAEDRKLLDAREDDMAPQGQYYYWFLQLIDQFRKKESLESSFIVDLTQPEFIEAGLLPEFPYKAASFGVRLNGRFQDVGRFLADFENTYPYFRVQNIKMSPQSAGMASGTTTGSGGDEKLMVELRIVTLIKPGTT
jgi:Tfp pilus assembly protein PilO